MTRQGTTAENGFSSKLHSTNCTEVSTLRHERFHRRALPKAQASGPGVDNARCATRIQDMLRIVKQNVAYVRGHPTTTSKKVVLRDCKFRFGNVSILVRGNYAAYCIFAYLWSQYFTNIPWMPCPPTVACDVLGFELIQSVIREDKMIGRIMLEKKRL